MSYADNKLKLHANVTGGHQWTIVLLIDDILYLGVTMSKSLGAAIKSAREKKGLSANDIADLLDIKGHAYRRYERGEVPLKAETFIAIAHHLGISLDELAGKTKAETGDGQIIYQKIPSKKGTKVIFTVE